MANRSRLYRKGFFRQHELKAPVISVGNLVLGGTGKTPLVLYIAKFLLSRSKKPAILSRGYKGTASEAVNVVSDGKTILMDVESAGDEPRLLAEKLPGTPVITGRKRWASGRFALENFDVDHIILDDGFQHLAVKRDLDLVLFSTRKLLGNGRVLPGGELREPLSALKRADAFIVTGGNSPENEDTAAFFELLKHRFPEKPVFTGTYVAGAIMTGGMEEKNNSYSLPEVRKISVYGFCGIAQPESFHNTLQQAGLKLAGFQAFADHHAYSSYDIDELCRRGKSTGAQALVTTEKDLVKLGGRFPQSVPLLALSVRLRMEKSFDRFLQDRLGSFWTR